MPFERTRVRLGELIRVKHGFAFRGEHFVDEPTSHVLVTPGNFAIRGGFQDTKLKFYRGPVPDEYILKPGDLVVTMTDLSRGADTLGYGALVPNHPDRVYLHNQRVGLVEVLQASKVTTRWLHYLMRTAEYRAWVVGSASGSTVKHTSPSRICDFEFELPDINVQHEAAATLDALENRINLLREANVTLEAIAEALFKSWFVDFDPVRAKAEGREPDEMDAATAALFPTQLYESALGCAPVGWEQRRIEDVAAKVGMGPFGSNIKVSTFVDVGVPVLTGACLKEPLLTDEDFRFITEQHAKSLSGSLVGAGDIVITHRGTLGQVSLIPSGSKHATYVLSQSQFFVRADHDATTAEFLIYFLRSEAGQHQLLANTSQVGVPSISRPVSYLKSMRLSTPPIEVAKAFSAVVTPLHQRTVGARCQIDTLVRLRDLLMPRLISGKLRMPQTQQLVEEVQA